MEHVPARLTKTVGSYSAGTEGFLESNGGKLEFTPNCADRVILGVTWEQVAVLRSRFRSYEGPNRAARRAQAAKAARMLAALKAGGTS